MGKSTIVSANDIYNSVEERYKEFDEFEWNHLNITVQHTIELEKVLTVVENIVDMCYTDDEDIYMPEVLEYAKRYNIVLFYTNIEMPNDLEQSYFILFASNIYDYICQRINPDQLFSITDGANKRIELKNNAKVSMLEKQFSELYSMISEIKDNVEHAVNDMSFEEVSKLATVLAEKEVAEGDIARAVAEASIKNGEQ